MQVGLAEMKPVVDMTGGVVVQTDTFHNPVFKESFKRAFVAPGSPSSLEVASNATFEVSACGHPCTPDIPAVECAELTLHGLGMGYEAAMAPVRECRLQMLLTQRISNKRFTQSLLGALWPWPRQLVECQAPKELLSPALPCLCLLCTQRPVTQEPEGIECQEGKQMECQGGQG